MNKTKISKKQLMALAFISLISPIIRAIPESALYFGGKASWLSPLAAAVPVLLLFCLIQFCMKTRNQNEGLTHIILKAFGPWFGRAIAILFALWLIFYLSFVLRMASERLVSYVYNDESWMIFALVITVTGGIAASGKLNNIIRSAQIFVPIIIGMLIAVFLMLITDIKIENLLPITYMDIPDALRGSFHLISMVGVFAYYTFLEGHTEKREKSKSGIGYIISMLLIVMLVLLTTIGVMSVNVAKAMQSPFYVMIRNISFFNILERIEAVVVALWVISDFVYAGSMLIIISDIIKTTINGKERVQWVWLAAGTAFVISVLMGNSSFFTEQKVGVYIPTLNLVFAFGLIPIVLLTAKLKKVL